MVPPSASATTATAPATLAPSPTSVPPRGGRWAELRLGPGAVWAGASWRRWLLLYAAYIAAVVVLGALKQLSGSDLPIKWCAISGLDLVALLFVGVRLLPAVIVGRLLDAVAHQGTPLSPEAYVVALLAALVLALGVEIATTRGGLDYRLDRTRDAWTLTGLVAVVATLWAAIGAAGAWIVRGGTPHELWAASQLGWLSEAVGMLTVAPVFMTVIIPAWQRRFVPAGRAGSRVDLHPVRSRALALESTAWLLVQGFVVAAALSDAHLERDYLCLLPMIVIALRAGVGGAAAAAFVCAVVSFAVTPVGGATQPPDLGLFLLVLSLTGLSLGALANERSAGLDAALRSQARLEQAQELATLGHWELDQRSLRVRLYADSLRLFGGASMDEVSIDDLLRVVHPEDRARVRRVHLQALEQGGPVTLDYRVFAADGTVRHVTSALDWVRGQPGRERHLAGSVLDVTERTRVEQTLRESEQRFRQLVENLEPGFWLLSTQDWRFVYVSPSLTRIWGVSEEGLLMRPMHVPLDWVHPDDRDRVAARFGLLAAGSERGYEIEYRHVRPDGDVRWLHANVSAIHDADGKLSGASGFVTDVTDQRRLEEQLAHAQRMESIGRLAGGVAHDFNNLLTVILGHLDLLGSSPALDAAARDDVGQARTAAERATGLTRQLLAFARRQVVSPSVVDAGQLVRGAEKLLRSLVGEFIEVELRVAVGPLPVRVDRGSFEQVLVNLVTNARDAMPAGGRITLDVREAAPSEARLVQSAAGVSPACVALVVSDTGHGMSPDVVARAFEPFFTTKEPGKGTGLGLASCYGIAQQAGGHIRVESAPGAGATFTLVLPRAPEAALERAAPTPSEASVRGGHETILFVEDEPVVRRLGVRALTAKGYRVLEAGTGLEALARIGAHDGPLDLVVTDVVMPELGGVDLAKALADERPGLPVLFVSGYREAAPGETSKEGRRPFLEKPYVASTLQARVREILDGRA